MVLVSLVARCCVGRCSQARDQNCIILHLLLGSDFESLHSCAEAVAAQDVQTQHVLQLIDFGPGTSTADTLGLSALALMRFTLCAIVLRSPLEGLALS